MAISRTAIGMRAVVPVLVHPMIMPCGAREVARAALLIAVFATLGLMSVKPTRYAAASSHPPESAAARTRSQDLFGELTGPTQARPGETVTYRVPFTNIGEARLLWSDVEIEYVSSRTVSGSGELVNVSRVLVRWLLHAPGELELVLRIPRRSSPGALPSRQASRGQGQPRTRLT
jgi:hypothetical protein